MCGTLVHFNRYSSKKVSMRLVYLFLFFSVLACRSSSKKNNNGSNKQRLKIFENISNDYCDCITKSESKKFGKGDSCYDKVIAKYNLQLKSLKIDTGVFGGKLQLGFEISSKMSKTCPYYIEQEKLFMEQVEKESSVKTFQGTFVDQQQYTNGEYIITLESNDSLAYFIATNPIKDTDFKQIVKQKKILIVKYKEYGPENRVVGTEIKK